MAKNALSRFLSDRVDIMIMPRSGTSRKFKLTGLSLICVIGLWLILTLGAFWAWSKMYDYQVIKADNQIMHVKMQLIADELERGRKYLNLTQTTDSQMRQMLGMPGSKLIKLPKELEEKNQKADERARKLFNADLKDFDVEEFEKYIDGMQENAQERLASFQEIAWYYANQVEGNYSTPSIRPSSARISSGFGYRHDPFGRPTGRMHNGVDFAGKPDSPIVATANGVVRHTGWVNGYGQAVLIDHGFGYSTLYAHATGLKVKEGDVVKRGQQIASMGTTGRSTGTHLHYEVWKDGKPVNPRHYFK